MTETVHGYQNPYTLGAEFNAQYSIIKAILSRVHTSIPCRVLNVTNDGGVAPVGFVDIYPLVNQLTGDGTPFDAGIIHNVPYFRLQGGSRAIIIDPVEGDIGDALFAERDISNVIINKGVSNPGSARQYDISDAIFIGGTLNAAPTDYVRFYSDGIDVKSTGKITATDGSGSVIVMNNDHTGTMTFSAGLTINANIQVNGAVVATGEGTFNGGHTVSQHVHAQAPDSHGDTEQPTNKPTG